MKTTKSYAGMQGKVKTRVGYDEFRTQVKTGLVRTSKKRDISDIVAIYANGI